MAKRTRTREPAAFSFRLIALLGGGLLLSLAVISAVLFATVRQPTSAQRNAAFTGDDGVPQPRLQAKPRDDLADFSARKKTILNEYAWVDRSNGVVRIPIDRAMDIVASRPPKAAERSP